MKRLHRRYPDTWYEYNGAFFRVADYDDLSMNAILDKIENPKLPSCCKESFETISANPLVVFRVGGISSWFL